MKVSLYNDLGYCEVVSHHGSDEGICQTARLSYGALDSHRTEEDNKKLLRYLFINRHTSPLEQANITFHIKMPIFVMRQFVRHRTFKLNEFSARYKKLPDVFYVPAPCAWRAKGGHNKQGSIEGDFTPEDRELFTALTNGSCERAFRVYTKLLEKGVAAEQARMVLPLNVMTEIVVQCDLHNLLHFLFLRDDDHAQKEIRDLAVAMSVMAAQLFPWTFELYHQYKPKMVDRI